MNIKPLSPKRIGAIISAHTGIICGDLYVLLDYAREKLHTNISVDDLGSFSTQQALKIASKEDFKALHRWCGGQ